MSLEISRAGVEQARRYGHRQVLSMLVGNASSSAIQTGDWDWARDELQAVLDEAPGDAERQVLLTFVAQLDVESGRDAEVMIADIDAWLRARVGDEPWLESSVLANQALRALRDGDLAASASLLLASGRRDPYNAVIVYADAALFACMARDGVVAAECADALRETRSHAPSATITLRLLDAVRAAGEGHLDAARAGILGAYAAFADLGAARRQALTGLVAATVLGTADPGLRRAVDESRRLLERMGAGLWLAHLDAILAGSGLVDAAGEVEPIAGAAGPSAWRDTSAPTAGPA
jgi:hypothetical protein